jgi:nonribosomal peptide synthetase DhbF
MLAVRLATRIGTAFSIELPVRALFEALTVAGLIQWMEVGSQRSSLEVLLPLRPSGSKPPLFCVHPGWGLSWCFSGLVRHLPDDCPVDALQARGIAEPNSAPHKLEEMAADYVQQIRSIQTSGPYYLLGFCFGGNVAQEIATQLEEQGEQVALLAILDTYPRPQETVPCEQMLLAAILEFVGCPLDGSERESLTRARVIDTIRETDFAAGLEEEHFPALIETFMNNTRLATGFSPHSYNGDMLFFTATPRPSRRSGHRRGMATVCRGSDRQLRDRMHPRRHDKTRSVGPYRASTGRQTRQCPSRRSVHRAAK